MSSKFGNGSDSGDGTSLQSMPAGAVILLNGYPAVGKSTVARELVKRIPNARILEYHALRLVVDSLADRDKEEKRWNQLKKALLQTLLHTLSTPSSTSSGPTTPPIYILTAHLCATPNRLSLLHAHLSDLPLIHVMLSCSTEENIRRLNSPTRPGTISSESGTDSGSGHGNSHGNGNSRGSWPAPAGKNDSNYMPKKVTDEHTLRELRMEEDLARFLRGRAGVRDVPGLIGEYEVNTDRLSARDTAGIVGEYALETLRREGWWFHLARRQ